MIKLHSLLAHLQWHALNKAQVQLKHLYKSLVIAFLKFATRGTEVGCIQGQEPQKQRNAAKITLIWHFLANYCIFLKKTSRIF